MMIRKVVLRRFKRFDDVTFDLPGNVVLAGPNNTGKTTLLQAIAAWSLGINRWKQLNDFQRHRGAYSGPAGAPPPTSTAIQGSSQASTKPARASPSK
jgi:chromosome segregation ATPase